MTCETLTLDKFIKIICGVEPTPDWWDDFTEDYANLKQDNTSKQVFKLTRDINVLELDLFLIQEIVNWAAKDWDQRFGEMLRNNFGYSFKYEDGPGLQKELQQTISIAKAKIVEKNELLYELNEIKKKDTDKKPLTELDFLVQIESYAKWRGSPIPVATTTVKEYIVIQHFYELYIIEQKRSNGGK